MDSSSYLRQRRDLPSEERLLFDDDDTVHKKKRKLITAPPKKFFLGLLLFPFLLLFLLICIVCLSSTFETTAFTLPPPPELKGHLAVNTYLQNPVKLLENELTGPESILIEGDTIYTGTADGRVLKIVRSSIVSAKRLGAGKSCGHLEAESRCGRPMGIRRLDNDRIVVVDAYHGIYAIDFEHDLIEVLLDVHNFQFNGRKMLFLNDVDVLNSDEIFFTESSSKWPRQNFNYILMENQPNGRLFKYKISTRELTVLMDNLYYPNGIQILPDRQNVLVSETNMARILKYSFDGISMGTHSVWAANLPGLPNNIRMGYDSTVWVGFIQARHNGDLSLVDALSHKPWLRKAMLTLIPNQIWNDYSKYFTSKHTIIVQLDQFGLPMRSLQDPQGHDLNDISEVRETDEYLYFGSLSSHFIARVHKHTYEHHIEEGAKY